MKKQSLLQLEDLAQKNCAELNELFAAADTPRLADFEGIAKGRFLAGKGLMRSKHLRNLITHPKLWPWKGKAFTKSKSKQGINRLGLGPVEKTAMPFQVKIESKKGQQKLCIFNYNIKGNHWPVTLCRDRVKKLHDGLFLGTFDIRWRKNYHFILYFGMSLQKLNTKTTTRS